MGIDALLKQAREISKRHGAIERANRVSGGDFDIFKILNLRHKELSHSRFLETLLDPKGDHGRGDLFLGLFIKAMLPGKSFKRI